MPLQQWRAVLPSPVGGGDVRAASFAAVRRLLDAAVEGGLSGVELFADPGWHAAGRLVLVPGAVLDEIDRHYRLRTVLEPVATDLAGRPVRMQWLLLGAGWLLMGYDRPATIQHPDYGMGGGRYVYRRFLRMRAGLDAGGRPALTGIEGADAPLALIPGLPGPLGSALQTFAVAGDRIVCAFRWGGLSWEREVDRHPIERRTVIPAGRAAGQP
jgi:hypothetical protein